MATAFGRHRDVTRSSIVEDWLDTFYKLCLNSQALNGHPVADDVALRMCRNGYSPADALERYLVLNQVSI